MIFYGAKEDEYSPSKFYYPEDLETLNVEAETGIDENQESKGANTNNKMATDLTTLLH